MTTDFQGKRVLVTGGTGFIGSFLTEELLRRDAAVRVPLRSKNKRSLFDRQSEIEWMEGALCDTAFCRTIVADVGAVFHLASERRNVRFHHKHYREVLEANVVMTAALIEALKDCSSVPVVFFSTGNIPGDCNADELSRQKIIDGYVVGKAACEGLWLRAQKERGFPLLILRPVGIYGPRDTFSKEGNVIPALMVKAQTAKDALVVWGSGKQKRSFLYVEDTIRALFALMEADAEGVQPLVSPESVTIADLAENIRDLVHPGLPITFDASKPEGTRSLPTLPLHASLQRFKWMPLVEGLKRTWEWWRAKEISKPVEAVQGVR